MSLNSSSCEYCFMTDNVLVGAELKRVHFRFGLEASDVYFEFRNLFCSLPLFPIRLVCVIRPIQRASFVDVLDPAAPSAVSASSACRQRI